METFDVIIVGARCAGAPLAKALTDRGLRVCVLDKATFPSDTPSTSALQSNGVDVLRRLGMLDRVLAAGPPVMRSVTTVSPHSTFTLDVDPQTYGMTLGVTRTMLDAALVESAAHVGADVRVGSAVKGVIVEAGRVVGVRTASGDLYAGLVVGADGRNSTVAASVGASEYCSRAAGRLPTWSIYEGADIEAGFFFGARSRPGGGTTGFLGTPLDGGRFLAAAAVPIDVGQSFLKDRYRNFDIELELFPELAEATRDATRVGPLRVLQRWHSYFRTSAGPGWVLVGDAGNFKDYSLGQGMSDAMRQAETLAAAVELGFETNRIDAHTRRWWRWRDQDAWQMYWTNCLIGEPYLPEALADAIFEPGARDPEVALRLAGILNKTIPPLRAVPTGAFLTATARTTGALIAGSAQHPRHALRQARALASMARFTAGLVVNHPSGPVGATRYGRSPRSAPSVTATTLP
ncbi:FAD-dependent oxidoreductase [Nocardioides limicola]|uniref:FAD-dependent oxidoreductase n=1 Tax=Nocardioides limicola TaxID=2803368 RepID=UPI00193C2402|nr:NAD(P)/FAD-dependent oxidoreductase [Nocardioides sp. DJM-14]